MPAAASGPVRGDQFSKREPAAAVTSVSDSSALFDAAVRKFSGAEPDLSYLETPGVLAFATVDGEDFTGWCRGQLIARPDGTSMLYLHHIEVAEPCRGRGLGRALLDAFTAAGQEAGAIKLFPNTGQANMPARRLYESRGGRPADQGPTVSHRFLLESPRVAAILSPASRSSSPPGAESGESR